MALQAKFEMKKTHPKKMIEDKIAQRIERWWQDRNRFWTNHFLAWLVALAYIAIILIFMLTKA